MTDTEHKSPNQHMYDAGFGTGAGGDLRATQVKIPTQEEEDGFLIHNILGEMTSVTGIIGVLEPIPMTMCGIQLQSRKPPYGIVDEATAYIGGATTCSQCAILAAWRVVSVRRWG